MTVRDERFEDRLLRELRAHVEERRDAAQAPAGASVGAGRRERRVPRLALAGGGLTAVAIALALATGGSGTPEAFALETQDDGSITVEITSLRDADGLEAALRAKGVNADVTYLDPGMTCKPGRFREPAAGTNGGMTVGGSSRIEEGRGVTFTVTPVPDGQTVVITTSTGPGTTASVGIAIAAGPVAACEQVRDTAPAPVEGARESRHAPAGPSLTRRDG